MRILQRTIERTVWVGWRERRPNHSYAVFFWLSSYVLLQRIPSSLTIAHGRGSFRAIEKRSSFNSIAILHKALRIVLMTVIEEQLRSLTLVRVCNHQCIIAEWATVRWTRRILIILVIGSCFLGILIKDWSHLVFELGWLWFGSWLVKFKAFHSLWHEELLSLYLLHVADLFFQDLMHSLIFDQVSFVLSDNSSVLKTDSWGLAGLVESVNVFSWIVTLLFCPPQQRFWSLNVSLSQFLFFFFLLFLQFCTKLDSLSIQDEHNKDRCKIHGQVDYHLEGDICELVVVEECVVIVNIK